LKVLKEKPDERLLIEAAQRDPARFAELYEENFERVYAYISRRVYVRVDVEDLTAEVFHQALAKIGQFEWRGVPFVAWLYRIAANAVADRWQSLARENGRPMMEVPSVEFDDSEIDRTEHRAQLFRNVAKLPAEQRRVIEMRFAEEKSIAEIARELKRSAGAIKQLQFRGIQTLREHWTKRPRKKLGGPNA
jgi:RNA polymerase sigma-70 factor (ECF subfamily)